jgi:hypothetical protein
MKADSHIPSNEIEIWKSAIRNTLGPKARRVGWDRLIEPVCFGGYGLIDPSDLHDRSLKSWLLYIWRSSPSSKGLFEELLHNWTETTKSLAKTVVGPLLSWNTLEYFVPFWHALAKSLRKVAMGGSVVPHEEALKWNFSDRSSGSIIINTISIDGLTGVDAEGNHRDMSGVIAKATDTVNLRRMSWMRWKSQLLYKEDTYKWRPNHTLKRILPSQSRWNVDGFLWRNTWNAVRQSTLPLKVKDWWLDAINTNLSICYKSSKCYICHQIVGSGHFLYECDGIREIKNKLGPGTLEYAVAAWTAWRLHLRYLHPNSVTEESLIASSKRLLTKISP